MKLRWGAIFGKSNRSAAIRIPGYVKESQKSRLEFRTIDATCNPYYAIASMLMAGLDGIAKNIDTEEEGYGPYEKNLYECSDSIKNLSFRFKRGTERVENGQRISKTDIFRQSYTKMDFIKRKRDPKNRGNSTSDRI